MTTERSDEELIRGFLNGNAADFDVVYERYKRQLYAYLNKILPDEQSTVDDLFQQTWLKAINQMQKYQNRERFLAWMMRIAHNLAMDYFRSKRRWAEESYDEIPDGVLPDHTCGSPLQKMVDQELGASIRHAVSELAPELREVFLLRQNDVAFKEIAEIQKCSINTVLARMQYALRNLRKSLAEWQTMKGGLS